MSYTQYYRNKYDGIGYFFQDRFKSFVIQEGKYILECERYVERNPVKTGMVNNPGEYKWSSYNKYMGKEDELIEYNPEYLGLSEEKKKGLETVWSHYGRPKGKKNQ